MDVSVLLCPSRNTSHGDKVYVIVGGNVAKKKYSSTCTGKAKTASTEHLVSSIGQDTTCASDLQEELWNEDDPAEAGEEMIMFTYLGKKKYVRNATVSNGSINLCDDESDPQEMVASQSKDTAHKTDEDALKSGGTTVEIHKRTAALRKDSEEPNPNPNPSA